MAYRSQLRYEEGHLYVTLSWALLDKVGTDFRVARSKPLGVPYAVRTKGSLLVAGRDRAIRWRRPCSVRE